MARLVKVDLLGFVNVHQFRHLTTGALVFVECSDEEYAALGRKGGGPPPSKAWPSPSRNYRWVGSSGRAVKLAEGKYGLAPGEMYVEGNEYHIRPHDPMQKTIIVDASKHVITGDVLSRNTTLTVTPDPKDWRIVAGDLSPR